VRRPPLLLVLAAVALMALGATAGAVMGGLGPETERYARARIAANASAHGLLGAAEYDDEVVAQAIFAAEAGLSFLHTHAEGLGPLLLVVGTLVATLVPGRRTRGVLHALLVAGALFPLGYLVYGLAVLELGRDAGVSLAERYVLTPLGSAVILGLLGLLAILVRVVRNDMAG
jgi:hypothetical protein